MSGFFIAFYSAFVFFLKGLSPLLYMIGSKKTKNWIRLRSHFKDNFYKASLSNNTQNHLSDSRKKLWFHASSGEIEYIKAVIRELRKQNSPLVIVVTYSSPSAPALFKNIQNEVDEFIPLGWDTKNDNLLLIKYIKPDLVVFSRTDFWPNLIFQLQLLNISAIALSLYPKSSHLSLKWLSFVTQSFKLLTTVNEETTQLLKKYTAVPVLTVNDTRFDQVFFRLNEKQSIYPENQSRLIVFGSTWPKDEAVLIEATQALIENGYKIIWAPHEPNHALPLQKKLEKILVNKKPLKVQLFSANQNMNDLEQILLVDQVGYLAELYKLSSLAFVGGSFVAKVHSVMEPLCAQNIVFVGPYHQNNPEALFFKKSGLVIEIKSAHELVTKIYELETNAMATTELKKLLKQKTFAQQGGTTKAVNFINKLLKNEAL